MSLHPDFQAASYYTTRDGETFIAIKFDGCTNLDIDTKISKNFLPTLQMIAKILNIKGYNKMKKAELVQQIESSALWHSLFADKPIISGLPLRGWA